MEKLEKIRAKSKADGEKMAEVLEKIAREKERVEAENFKNTEKMKSVLASILAGDVYAHIKSVASSGMSRRILFFRVNKYYDESIEDFVFYIERITAEIGWLSGELKMGEYKQGEKWVVDEGLKVSGCGMDMIFHTLYKCMPYEQAKDWNQNYKIL